MPCSTNELLTFQSPGRKHERHGEHLGARLSQHHQTGDARAGRQPLRQLSHAHFRPAGGAEVVLRAAQPPALHPGGGPGTTSRSARELLGWTFLAYFC